MARPMNFDVTQALRLVGAETGTSPRVALGLAEPLSQRLRAHPQLLFDRGDRGPLRGVVLLVSNAGLTAAVHLRS